jgi:CheY-like chemotaxis protein/HPt (histidine-containing phosphotransfer) domain-containing protein
VRVSLTLDVAAPGTEDAGLAPVRRPLPSRAEAEREGSVLLLVEDHPVNREILALQLAGVGFVTDTAADAGEALDRFAGTAYGLVFTDIQLPGADGHELARGLRALEAATGRPRVPIVALTANALRGERERCAASGMDDLVVKPATLETLARTLRRWLPDCAWPTAGLTIDGAALEELTGGDAELGREIVDRYLVSLGDDLAALERARRAGDLGGVRRHAHRIVGASRTVGAHAVATEAARLERAAGEAPDRAELARLAGALRASAARA